MDKENGRKTTLEMMDSLIKNKGAENIAEDLQLIYYRYVNFVLDTEDILVDDSRIMYTLRIVIETLRGK